MIARIGNSYFLPMAIKTKLPLQQKREKREVFPVMKMYRFQVTRRWQRP
jgi:hypothetical protein